MKKIIIYSILLFTALIFTACSSNQIVMEKDDQYFVRIPNDSYSIKFPSSELTYLDFSYTLTFGDKRYLFRNEKNGINLAVEFGWDFDSKPLNKYRDSLYSVFKKLHRNMESVVFTNKDDYSAFEYFLPVADMSLKNQYNYLSYFKCGGYWINVWISKNNYQPNQYPLFSNIFENIKIEKNIDSPLSIQDSVKEDIDYRLLEANSLFDKNKYVEIIPHLEKIVSLQKDYNSLDENEYYTILSQLAITYGAIGNTDKAIEIANYGLTIDPKYPMFYYSLACAYADKDNFDLVLSNLEMAVKYKYRFSFKQSLPNPSIDPSFKKYLNKEEFIGFLKRNKFY